MYNWMSSLIKSRGDLKLFNQKQNCNFSLNSKLYHNKPKVLNNRAGLPVDGINRIKEKRDQIEFSLILIRCAFFILTFICSLAVVDLYNEVVYQEVIFKEFVDSYLTRGIVERLEVVNKEWVRIFVFPENQTNYKKFWFRIGSVEIFDKHLENVHLEKNIKKSDFVPVVYKSQMSWVLYILILCIFDYTLCETSLIIGDIMCNFLRRGIKIAKIINPSEIGVKFRNVVGCEDAKADLMKFVSFLKYPQQHIDLAAKIPKGAILIGQRGSGKTLLAKATAGEANVPIIIVPGFKLLKKCGDMGPSKVNDIFSMAQKNAPCILFLDQIDAVGSSTCNSITQEEILNQILYEMDGVNATTKVVVLAATNKDDILDEALFHTNRFYGEIFVTPPDIKERASIFALQLQPLKTRIDKSDLAQKMAALTPGFTGGDIAKVCNEAALIAARNLKECIQMNDFKHAVERVDADIEEKAAFLQPDEKRTVAYHEAGHVVAGWFLEHPDILLKVTIVPSGKNLGYTQYLLGEQYLPTKEQLFNEICKLLSGKVAEKMFLEKITTGNTSDFKKATHKAYAQVLEYGMNEKLGHVSFDMRQPGKIVASKLYSEATAQMVDSEVRELMSQAYNKTVKLLTKHRENVEKVALRLLDKHVLRKNDIIELLGPRPFKEQTTYEEDIEEIGCFEKILSDQTKDWNTEFKKIIKTQRRKDMHLI